MPVNFRNLSDFLVDVRIKIINYRLTIIINYQLDSSATHARTCIYA